MRFLLRVLGGWAILVAVIALVDDVTRSYQTGVRLGFASLGKDWALLSPGSLDGLKAALERHMPALWDPLTVTLLRTPAFALFAVLGVALYLAGVRRRGVNIYAN